MTSEVTIDILNGECENMDVSTSDEHCLSKNIVSKTILDDMNTNDELTSRSENSSTECLQNENLESCSTTDNISVNCDTDAPNVDCFNEESHDSACLENDVGEQSDKPYDMAKQIKELEDELLNIRAGNVNVCERDLDDDDDDVGDRVKNKAYSSKKVKETSKHIKEREKELQNIHSESQRIARETTVDLPYHRPHISSLSEFLKRKSTSSCKGSPLTDIQTTPNFSTNPKTPANDGGIGGKVTSTTNSDFKTPILSDFKRRILKTSNLGNITPRLNVKSEFVDLDLDEIPKGVNSLMSRFLKHSQKKLHISPEEVKLHLVCKDVDRDGHEDLKSKEITVKLQNEIKSVQLNTEKFSVYKQQLRSVITKKKLEKQESLFIAHELDNEEGFEEELDEEILSDDESDNGNQSDSDSSELEDVLNLGDPKEDESVSEKISDTLTRNNTDDSLKLVLEDTETPDLEITSCVVKPNKLRRHDSMALFLEDSQVDDSQNCDLANTTERNTSKDGFEVRNEIAKMPHDELDGSFELQGSIIPAYQPGGGLKYGGCEVSDDEVCNTTPIRISTIFGRESQEYDSEPASPYDSPVCSTRRVSGNLFNKGEINDTQNFNDLLSLCSGKFTDTKKNITSPEEKLTYPFKKNIFSDTQNFCELLDLCSGKFTNKITTDTPDCNESNSDEDEEVVASFKKKVANKINVKLSLDSEESEAETDNEDDHESSDDKGDISKTLDESGMENDEDKANDNESSDQSEDELCESAGQDSPKDQVRQKVKVTDFFEDEAELSGSDVGSDDEDEGDEEEQIFDDAVPSDEEMTEEELRGQVGRVHLKKLMDDDKRELRFFQEMYLEDGELHSEGGGRERKFRWQNADSEDNSHQNGDHEGASGDEADQNGGEEEKWRVQRFERDKWLQEQEALHSIENWKGFKLVKRNKAVATQSQNSSVTQTISPVFEDKPKSFLARNKEFCSQLAEKFQKQETERVGRRSTKNFVFVTKSPEKSCKRSAEPVVVKEAKIRKLNTSVATNFPKKSVFNFIE